MEHPTSLNLSLIIGWIAGLKRNMLSKIKALTPVEQFYRRHMYSKLRYFFNKKT